MSTDVDAHHHVWSLARGDYGWLTPAMGPIYGDFSLADARPAFTAARIDATVLVQAAATVAETRYLLDIARRSDGLVRGVVGWVDLADPDAIATLGELAADPLLKGVRPMLQDLPDPEWILRADVGRALAVLPGLGLRFDALVKPSQLRALPTLLERHPDLAMVVDHAAKPDIRSGQWEPWAGLMRAVAAHPGVCCKVSGLVTEAGDGWTAASLRRWFDHLVDCFGPQRLMWGSDWPVVDLAGGYASWHAATLDLAATLTPVDRASLLGGAARRFYGL